MGSSNTLFTVGAITVITAVLVPAPSILADILILFSIFAAAATVMISFANVKNDDLKGFAGMGVLVSAVRILASIILLRGILSGVDGGYITGTISSYLLGNALLSTVALSAMIVVVGGLVVHRIRYITQVSRDYFEKVLKVKQMYIASALRSNVMDRSDAEQLESQFNNASSFFKRINSCARFTFCEHLLTICVFIFGAAGIVTVSATDDNGSGTVIANVCILAVGISLLSVLSLVSIYAISRISDKCLTSTKKIDNSTDDEPAIRRTVNSTIAKAEATIEATDNVIEIKFKDELHPTETDGYEDAQEATWYDADDMSRYMTWQRQNIDNKESLAMLANVIQGESFDSEQVILIASDNIASLPVTVPVNLAVELGCADMKCLIVDLDLKREAISNVFDIGKGKDNTAIIESGVTGISVLCASWINENSIEQTSDIIKSAVNNYDRILIYAPDIRLSAKVEAVCLCCDSAMLFGKDTEYGEELSSLRKELAKSNCDFIEPDEVLVLCP